LKALAAVDRRMGNSRMAVVDAYLGMLAAHGEPQSHLEDARTVLAALRSRHAR
jgi:hypothetical protein